MTREPCPTAAMLAQWRAAFETERRTAETRNAIEHREPRLADLRRPANTKRPVTLADMARVADAMRTRT